MNKTIQLLTEAINMIPRQFFSNVISDDTTVSAYERFVSQLIVKYRKIAGGYCRTELFFPSSDIIQKFASTAENKAMVKRLSIGISSVNEHKPTLFMEQTIELPLLSSGTIIELKTDRKLSRGMFYWDFFKLHFFVDQNRSSCGIYLIINQDISSVLKKIDAYYERGFFTSRRMDNIFFLIKKDYSTNAVVLNYKGENVV